MPSQDEIEAKKKSAGAGRCRCGANGEAAEHQSLPNDFLTMSSQLVSECLDGEAGVAEDTAYARSIVANAAHPLAVLDEFLRVVFASPSFYAAMKGAPGAQDDAFDLAPAVEAALCGTGGQHTVRTQARRLHLTAREIRGPHGGKTIVLSLEDAAGRQSLAEELRAAKAEAERANRMRERILAAANHTLRQPLQTICLVQGMLAGSVSDPKARKLIDRLDQGVAAMSEMLDRLLDMGCDDAGPENADRGWDAPEPESAPAFIAAPAGADEGAAAPQSSAAQMPAVFIVDDDAQIRETMRDAVERHGYAARVFADGADFLKSFKTGQTGCLIADAKMPGVGGLQLIEHLAAMQSQLSVVVITAYGDVAMAVQAMKAGAMDFLQKPVRQDELLGCIRRAFDASGEQSSTLEKNEAEAKMRGLTLRQRQILDLVLAGAPTKTIATDLNLSQRTVDNHRAAIMRKLGAKSLPSLIRIALAGQGVRNAAIGLS